MNFPFSIFHFSLPCARPAGGRKAGFTLVEIVTVVMIIAILMAATTTAISGARRSAMRTHSLDTVRQLAAAWTAYATNEGSFPATSKFQNSVGTDTYAASPYNIGGLLNTQYKKNRDGTYNYNKPRSNSTTYFDMTKEECTQEKSGEWPQLGTESGRRGVCDRWGHVVYFTLDFDLDGRVDNPVTGNQVAASALAYSTEKFTNSDISKYGKKFLVAW